jgi:hypothetical protein
MFWLLAITALLVALPIALILLALGLIFHQVKGLTYAKRYTQNKTRSFNVGMQKK